MRLVKTEPFVAMRYTHFDDPTDFAAYLSGGKERCARGAEDDCSRITCRKAALQLHAVKQRYTPSSSKAALHAFKQNHTP